MPKQPDPTVRMALIEAAARVLAGEGPNALTTRRLAAEVGTSTMAVYTYFNGMDELRHAVKAEGFERFARHLAKVKPMPEDPMTELRELGVAYFANAFENPDLYRFMFMEKPVADDPEIGMSTFERLVEGVTRAVDAGLLEGAPWELAQQLWVCAHGVVSLAITGFLTQAEALRTSYQMLINMYVAHGSDRAQVERALSGPVPVPTG